MGQFNGYHYFIGSIGFNYAFCVRINNSRVGRAFAAIKADDHAAELMGINVVYYKMMASSLVPSSLVSVVVCMLILQTLSIPTDFSYHKVVQILLFPVFGGSNVVWGSGTRFFHSYIVARSIAFLVRLSRYHLWCFTCYLDGCSSRWYFNRIYDGQN